MRTTAPPQAEAAAATLWRCGGRQCPPGECDHEDGELHRHAAGDGPAYAPPIVHEVLGSSGTPLPNGVRRDMELRLGHDFDDVRIHTDGRAARSATAVAAAAYTVGRQIVFGSGTFDPGSGTGRRLIAHELTHTADARPGSGAPRGKLRVSSPHEAGERNADTVARRATGTGAPLERIGGPSSHAPILQRATCALVPAGTCAAPIAGSAEDFGAAETLREVGPRDRRRRMSPARQVSTGHTGRARQLELILEAESPGLLANVHGIFLDRDMSPGTGALTDLCSNMVPPLPAPAGARVSSCHPHSTSKPGSSGRERRKSPDARERHGGSRLSKRSFTKSST